MYPTNKTELKQLQLINIISLAVLLFFSIYFFLERTTTLDTAYQGSLIYIHEKLAIQVQRYGSAFTQFFALMGVKLNFSLKSTLILYSSSFVIEALLIYWILSKVLVLENIATALVIYLTVLVGHTFFWAQSELLQASLFVILQGGLLYGWKDNIKWWHIFVFAVLSILITYTHPLAFIPMFFIWGFVGLSSSNKYEFNYYISFFLTFCAWVWKHFFATKGAYDEVTTQHADGLLSRVPRFFELHSTRNFWEFCLNDYYVFPVLFLLVVVFYTNKKKHLKLLWFLFFTLGTLVLINASYHWGAAQFHMESFYRIMVIFVGFAIAIDLLQDYRWRRWVISALLPIVFTLRLVAIWNKAPLYTQRVNYNKALIKKVAHHEGQKFILKKSDAPQPLPHTSWSIACETALLSSLENIDSTVAIFIVSDDDSRLENLEVLPMTLLDVFYTGSHHLRTKYFNFTIDNYVFLDKKDLE